MSYNVSKYTRKNILKKFKKSVDIEYDFMLKYELSFKTKKNT